MKQGKFLWISLIIWGVIASLMIGGMIYYTSYYIVEKEKEVLLSEDYHTMEKERKEVDADSFSLFPMEEIESEDPLCRIKLPAGVAEEAVRVENDYLHRCIYLYIQSEDRGFYTGQSLEKGCTEIQKVYHQRNLTQDIFLFSMDEIAECHYYIADGSLYLDFQKLHTFYDLVVAIDLSQKGEELAEDIFSAISAATTEANVKLIYIDRGQKDFSAEELRAFLTECEADYYLELLVGDQDTDQTGMMAYYQKYYYREGFGSIELADQTLRKVVHAVGGKAIGLQAADAERPELLQAGVPAAALYLGSLADPEERNMLMSDLFYEKMAKGIHEVIQAMMGEK